MASGCSITVLVTLVLVTVNNVSSECFCTETSTYCEHLDGKSFTECANSDALYIADSALDALSSSNFARLPHLNSLNVENSWSVKELPSDLFEPLVKIQDIIIINSSAFSKIGDMLYKNLEITNLILESNNISKIETRVFQKFSRLEKVNLSKNNIAEINSFPPQEYGPFYNLTKLQYIILRNNNISHIFKNSFVCKQNIIELDISNNEIENIDRGSFCLNGTQNVTLNISKNKIKHLLDETFSSCNAVTYLDLSYNQIEDLHPGVFRGLTKCKRLNLEKNYLHEVSSSVFSPLRCLQELELRKNKLQKLLVDQFGASTSLRLLNLSDNEITTIHAKTFRGLVSLEELNLANNNLVELGNSFSEFLPNVLFINITKNKLAALNHSAFRGCIKLKILDLSENALSAIKNGAFLNNDFLENLYLNNNNLLCIECHSFEGLRSLKNLYLGGNILESLSYLSFKNLRNLKSLSLHPISRNPCSCVSVAKLRNASVLVDIENEEFHSLCTEYRHCEKIYSRGSNETCCCSYENVANFSTPVAIHENSSIHVTHAQFTHIYKLSNTTQVSFHEADFIRPVDEQHQRVEETLQDHDGQMRESANNLEKLLLSANVLNYDLGVNSTEPFTTPKNVKDHPSSHKVTRNNEGIFQHNTSSYFGYEENKISGSQIDELSMVHIFTISVIVAGSTLVIITVGFASYRIYRWCRLRSHVYEEIRCPQQEPNGVQMVLFPHGITA